MSNLRPEMNDACPPNRMWRENLHLLDEWSPISNYSLQSPIVCHTSRLTLALFYRIKPNYNLSIISSVPMNLMHCISFPKLNEKVTSFTIIPRKTPSNIASYAHHKLIFADCFVTSPSGRLSAFQMLCTRL